ncbi:MAG: divalent metal cation transporter, partial [bacterium]
MKITQKIQFFLPGIFLLGFNIGTGSVTAMAKAGATYNMSLLWAVFVSCLITYFMIVMYGRFTLITGETALFAFKTHLHPGVGLFFIIALTVNVCGSVIGVMGIIADICYEWSKGIIADGISPVYIALFFILIVYLIFWNGRTQFFQRALAVIVAIMSASFIL